MKTYFVKDTKNGLNTYLLVSKFICKAFNAGRSTQRQAVIYYNV